MCLHFIQSEISHCNCVMQIEILQILHVFEEQSVNLRLSQTSQCGIEHEQKESLQICNVSRSGNDVKGSVK